jgi:hypothetical protein
MNRNDVDLMAGGARRVRHLPKRPGWKPVMSGCEGGVSGDYLGASNAQQAQKVATVALAHDPKVQAGMMLLRWSRRNPRARRKVLRIARRADAGDPKAMAAMQTLRAAKAVQNSKVKAKANTPANKQPPKGGRKQRLLLPAASHPTTAETPKKSDPFLSWKRGSG